MRIKKAELRRLFEQLPQSIYTGRMSCLPTRETTTPANTSKFERMDLLE